MMRKINDPNQLSLEFPDGINQKNENKNEVNNTQMNNEVDIESEKQEILEIKQDDLVSSEKKQKEILENINNSYTGMTYEERCEDIDYLPGRFTYKNDKKDKEWEEKEKNRIFDNGAVFKMRDIINSFRENIYSDVAFNGNFNEKEDARDFGKIKAKVEEFKRRDKISQANNLNRDMGVLRRISNLKNMLDNLDHQKFIDYIDDLKSANKNTCNIIVESNQYSELMEIINNYRKK